MAEDFGKWLKRQIAGIPMSQAEFARHSGIPIPSLKNWLAMSNPPIRPANLMRIARGLGVPIEAVEGKLHASWADPKNRSFSREELQESDMLGLFRRVPIITTTNYDDVVARVMPTIRKGYAVSIAPFERDNFAVVIADDFMVPQFDPGDLVIFSQLKHADPIIDGLAHAFQLKGEEDVTSRLLFNDPRDPLTVIARPANPKRTRADLSFRRDEVVRLGSVSITYRIGRDLQPPVDVTAKPAKPEQVPPTGRARRRVIRD